MRNDMKKILLLGGSAQQVVAIRTAKKLGYYTVVCDYLENNPGQYHADKFYLVSTTDKEAILEVAKTEKIDGVLAYASDPAAPTAAYVSEVLGLPTNPYKSVETLCNKDKFREFMMENGFCVPQSNSYRTFEEMQDDLEKYTFPIIVKPVDSSGSKGITVLEDGQGIERAIEFALAFSRCKRFVVEEFIEKKHPYLIGGDIFVQDGKVVLWGLMNCHRDANVNPLVPVGKSYPLKLDEEDVIRVKKTLQQLVDALSIKNGAMNVEVVVDKKNDVYLIDVGPRNGGNMIPDLLGMIFGVDVVEMAVKVAMNEELKKFQDVGTPYYATHNLHSNKKGRFKDVFWAEEIKPYVIKKCIYKQIGDEIEFFDNAAKAIGIVFFKFPDDITMKKYLKNINEYVKVLSEDA